MTDQNEDLDWKALYQEMFASWMTTLGVMIIKNGGEVTVTKEECEKIKGMGIQKVEVLDVNGKWTGDLKFVGVFNQPPEPKSPPA
jgi:hypothetical protein